MLAQIWKIADSSMSWWFHLSVVKCLLHVKNTYQTTSRTSSDSFPSLICEDFVFSWVYTDLNNLVDIEQFGNVKNTSHHTLSGQSPGLQILKFWETQNTTGLSFIDFRKVFELVNHTIATSKATESGLHPCMVIWLADCLTNRRQVVRYQGSTSSFQLLTRGVHQRTIMGSLCFLILIKYRQQCSRLTLQRSTLDRPINWTTQNKVIISHHKTGVMHHLRLHSALHPLQMVESTRLLGVTTDTNLDWKQYVSKGQAATFWPDMLRILKSPGTPEHEPENICKLYLLPKLTYSSHTAAIARKSAEASLQNTLGLLL